MDSVNGAVKSKQLPSTKDCGKPAGNLRSAPPVEIEDRCATIHQTIRVILDEHIGENRKMLRQSCINLDKIADYCETNYLQSARKDAALEETKAYATRALASVASQIHNYAANLAAVWDLQMNGLNELAARTNSVSARIDFVAEWAARREIGKLTRRKLLPAPTGRVTKPAIPERYAAKKRRTNYYSSNDGGGGSGRAGRGGDPIGSNSSIDYTILDELGVGFRSRDHVSSYAYTPQPLSGGSGIVGVAAAAAQSAYATAATIGMVSSNSNNNNNNNSNNNNQNINEDIRKNRRNWAPPIKSATLRPSKSANLSSTLSALQANAYAHERAHAQSPPPGQMSNDRNIHGNIHSATGRPSTPPAIRSSAAAAIGTNRFSTLSTRTAIESKDHYRSIGLLIAPPKLPNACLPPPSTESRNDKSESNDSTNRNNDLSRTPSSPNTIITTTTTTTTTTAASATNHFRSTNPFVERKESHPRSPSSSPSPPPPPPPPPLGTNEKISDTPSPSWIPENYIEKVIALYDYTADKDDELTFKENAVIYVIAKNDDGWWEGVMSGITGLFPGNYVEPCFM